MPSTAPSYFVRDGLIAALIQDGVIAESWRKQDIAQDVFDTIDCAHAFCVDPGAGPLRLSQVADRSGLSTARIESLFGDVAGVIQGVLTALRHTADAEIRGIANNPNSNWAADAPDIWDRHIEHLLAYYELSMRLEGAQRPADPAVPEQQTPEILEQFLNSLATAGISITPKREIVAEFSLAMLGYFRQLIVIEGDPESRRFLRRQVKTLIASYLPQAIVSD